jgi:hypothetical protein
MIGFYRQFSQGIAVAVCAMATCTTLGYMINDLHELEKFQLKSRYEKQIKVLNEEINRAKDKKEMMVLKL